MGLGRNIRRQQAQPKTAPVILVKKTYWIQNITPMGGRLFLFRRLWALGDHLVDDPKALGFVGGHEAVALQ